MANGRCDNCEHRHVCPTISRHQVKLLQARDAKSSLLGSSIGAFTINDYSEKDHVCEISLYEGISSNSKFVGTRCIKFAS